MESVQDFDDIVVLDGGSTDGALDIAREFGARIFSQREGGVTGKIENFTEIRKKAFDLAKHDWVFYVDSDEYISPELQDDIGRVIIENDAHKVYYFNRIAIVEEKVVRHAFLYPEYTLRLINKKGGTRWKEGAVVHEGFTLAANAIKVYLASPLYAIWPSYKEVIAKDNFYLSLVLKKFAEQARNFGWFKYLRSAVINLAKTVNILLKIGKVYVRYGHRETMPLKYQLRFVRYHLLMAFSRKKFKLMLSGNSYKSEIRNPKSETN
jgi:glycosyltransferase involved in cell wall biosynthesis